MSVVAEEAERPEIKALVYSERVEELPHPRRLFNLSYVGAGK